MPRGGIKADVAGCEVHTRRDDRTGDLIRLGPCNGGCRLAEKLKGGLPLSQFLVTLLNYTDEELRKANAKKAARVFKINEAHAEGYIRMQRELRNVGASR